ncbi:transposase, IS116/IS110/IS902 family [Parabacteroides johnsonii DSM 18315]|jgi:transposase|uniref:Transposase, IS116/IS110/IS902 family n=2 Tax=Parabacteroides johnsonii TaxID=387661 RepID=B7BDF0_9BACT|nr:IS110 family transposase [Parabacteroides johnsonii]EEC95542.1 transposase, IS116/IS110/IS902 family [Parabacteroides johnsonii DSM 18315]UEA89225.1 IS110 family transposase [Parabacteroides johnsonii]UWP41386.1 IS110 family transposase [Parabacteroides johnsonii DSM 18315]HJG99433.1 IS110 family transposase [Parabacteroides johnsonii]
MNKLFIGIDFSKKKVDVSVIEKENMSSGVHREFSNDVAGHESLLAWLCESYPQTGKDQMLFCGENTGLYSVCLSNTLAHEGYTLWLEHPYSIKHSSGMQRGKNDKSDSLLIAQYACRFEDMAKVYAPNTETIRALHSFFTFRDLLVKMKNEALVHAKELHSVLKGNRATDYIYQHSLTQVKNLTREIKDVEKEIMDLINSEEEIKNNYERITSIKGVAFVNALALIVYTENFTCFDDPRKLACYAGVVPFQRTSGSSVKGNAKTSGFANKKLNTLLTQAARTAAIHDPILREYYRRKREEGKHHNLVINNIRNKLIHRICALVRNQTFDQAA